MAAILNDRPLRMMTLEQALADYPAWADLYGGQDLEAVWAGSNFGGFNEPVFNAEMFNGPEPTPIEVDIEDASEPRSVTQVTPGKFVVLPLPDAEKPYSLRMVYALKPSRKSTGMPTAIFDELEDAITHSALQQLLVMPGMEWTDRELATYHARQSLLENTNRRARANLGILRGSLRATAPRFA
jgi:hypothetical protein